MRATLLAIAWLTGATAIHAGTSRFTVLVEGGHTKAGHEWITQGADGSTHVEFVFKDNGRGPEIQETFRLAPDGTFQRYQATGKTTFGADVNESFSRTGDNAQWHTNTDAGHLSVHGAAMYNALQGSPEAFIVAVRALLRRPEGALPLLPNGKLTYRKLLDSDIDQGAERRHLQLLAITGVGFTPTFVWMTREEMPQLFAFIVPGEFQLVPEGWEASGNTLESRQNNAEQALLTSMQGQLAHALPGRTLIRNARIFDSERAQLAADLSDLLIERGRIVAISPAGTEKRGAEHVIEADGRTLLPGLFDMHAHFSAWDGGLHLAAGITSIRDMGNDNETLQQLIAREGAGELLAPRIVPAGFIEGESPNAARTGFVIKDLAGAEHAVDWYHEHGYPQIKIYNSFPKDILASTTEYAHSLGMRVSGHIPVFLRAQEAVEMGYDEIQHINQVLLNFLVTDQTDTRTLERFYLPANKVADLDFDSRPVQDFIAFLVRRKTVIDPTLTAFDFLRQRDGTMSQAYASVADHVPPDVRRGFLHAEMKIPDDATAARFEKSYEKMVAFVGRMYRAGIPIVAGTDGLAGFTLQRELELYVQAGLTPSQALQVATYNGAKYARVLDDRGVILQGKRADLILVDGDPTHDIGDIRRVALVVKGDHAYYPADIDEALGIKAFTPALTVH